jgi:hypothetical protein
MCEVQRMTAADVRNALRLAGYSPIPVNGKKPPLTGWEQKVSTNPDEIALWEKIFPDAVNTGILTRVTPTFDADIFNPEAAVAVEDLVRERFEERGYILVRIGLAPKRAIPFRTATPFKKITRNLVSPCSSDAKPEKLELLGDGQQVVVFGIHEDTGKPYAWHGGEPGKIKWEDLPFLSADDALALIRDAEQLLITQYGYRPVTPRPKENTKSNGHAHGGGSQDWGWLVSNILNGHELHDSICAVAAKLVASGMRDDAAVNLIRGWVESSAAPRDDRWQDRLNDVPRAVSSARAKFGKAPSEPQTPPAKLFMPSGEFVKGFVAPEYVVDGLLLRGFSYSLTAMTGAGKTALSLLLAACVADTTKKFAGLETEHGRVIYFAGENSQDIRQRWIALSEILNFDADKIDVWFRDGVFKISTAAEQIRKEVEEIGGAILIIIDTSAAYFEGTNENDTVELRDHAARIRELCKLPGNPTLLTSCHPVKSPDSENLIPRGAGAYLNEVDGNLTIMRDDRIATLHWAGKIRGPEFEPIQFELKTEKVDRIRDRKGRVMPSVVASHISDAASEALEARAQLDEDRILQAIADGATSITKIAQALGWYSRDNHEPQKSRVHRGMKELKKARLVEVTARRTTITPKGQKTLKEAKDETGGESHGTQDKENAAA